MCHLCCAWIQRFESPPGGASRAKIYRDRSEEPPPCGGADGCHGNKIASQVATQESNVFTGLEGIIPRHGEELSDTILGKSWSYASLSMHAPRRGELNRVASCDSGVKCFHSKSARFGCRGNHERPTGYTLLMSAHLLPGAMHRCGGPTGYTLLMSAQLRPSPAQPFEFDLPRTACFAVEFLAAQGRRFHQ